MLPRLGLRFAALRGMPPRPARGAVSCGERSTGVPQPTPRFSPHRPSDRGRSARSRFKPPSKLPLFPPPLCPASPLEPQSALRQAACRGRAPAGAPGCSSAPVPGNGLASAGSARPRLACYLCARCTGEESPAGAARSP